MSKSFNVVIATAGRDTLQRMVDSIAPQLTKRDYLTIIWDGNPMTLQIQGDCQVISIQNPEPLGYWGHGSRTRWQNELPGDYLMNADDDDIYLADAMNLVRKHCTDHKLYLFQFICRGFLVPIEKSIAIGNVGTPCGVYPNTTTLPDWPSVYGGDGMFYQQLSNQLDVEFIMKPIYAVNGETVIYKKETVPENLICKCGGTMTYISVAGKKSAICSSCKKEIEL